MNKRIDQYPSNVNSLGGENLFLMYASGHTVNTTLTSIREYVREGLSADTNTFITGYTYNNNIFTLNDNAGNTFNATLDVVTGLTVNGLLVVDQLSASTYQNLPKDVYVTGATYNDANTFTFTNNDGESFNVSFDVVTGLTVNGSLSVNTFSASTYQNLPQYYAGVITGATNWVDNNDGSITLPDTQVALFDNPNFTGPINLYNVSSQTFVLNNNDTNYIGVDYNGGSPTYISTTLDTITNSSDIILYLIVYRNDNVIHTLEFGDYGAGLPNKINDRILGTDRFAHEDRKSTRLNSSHVSESRMPSSA